MAALGVKSKAPFQLLCTREALIWRTEELTRNACDALERDDFAAAAILTRAVTENAALAWQLLDVLEARKNTPEKLNDMLMRLLGGWRTAGRGGGRFTPRPLEGGGKKDWGCGGDI